MNEANSPPDDRGITGFAFRPDTGGFAATGRGLLVSNDGGVTWGSAFATIPDADQLPITAVTVVPGADANAHTIVAIPGGIGISHDRTSWEFVQLPKPVPLVTALISISLPAGQPMLIAGTWQDGILRSEDNGHTWSAWNAGLHDHHILALLPVHDQTLLAGTGSGLYQSLNAGRSWIPIDLTADMPAILSLAITGDSAGDEISLFAGTDGYGLFQSTDRGSSWSEMDEIGPGNAIHILTANAHTIAALGDEEVFVSRNDGLDWEVITDMPVAAAEITAMTLIENGASLLLGTDDGEIHQRQTGAGTI